MKKIDLTSKGREKIQRELNKKAIKTVREAQKNAPVDTGLLRSRITFEPLENRLGVVIGSNVNYAPHQEFGTENMPAQPFLRPALKKVFGKK